MEIEATEVAYGNEWKNDRDVTLVSQYLERIGYDWSLRLVDPNKNTYEILLKKDDKEFLLNKASSGEKEILNFLFGIFALRTRGGLLIIDEPELHLHPRWQAILRDLFKDLAGDTDNQFLLSTHSPVFITPETIGNVRRVVKNDEGSTTLITVTDQGNVNDSRSLLHIVNSHNNERIFFADKVVLVEGIHDRIIFENLIMRYREAAQLSEVVEIVEVHGKANFVRYETFLKTLGVPRLIIGDLDYGVDLERDNLCNLVVVPYNKIDERVFNCKKSKDRSSLSEAIEQAVISNDMDVLQAIWEYIKGRFVCLRDNLTDTEEEQLHRTLNKRRQEGIYVLRRGEIEEYLPLGNRDLNGTIKLLEPQSLLQWINSFSGDGGFAELENIVFQILKIPDNIREDIRGKVKKKLNIEVVQIET